MEQTFVTTTEVKTKGDPQWTVYSSCFALSMIFVRHFYPSAKSSVYPVVESNEGEIDR
jgi:hypothetical protein